MMLSLKYKTVGLCYSIKACMKIIFYKLCATIYRRILLNKKEVGGYIDGMKYEIICKLMCAERGNDFSDMF